MAASRSSQGETQADQVTLMVAGFALVTLFWLAVFYSMAWSHRYWGRWLPTSPKEHENDRYWLTQHIVGSVMAAVVAGMSLPGVLVLHTRPDPLRFFHTDRLAFCQEDDFDDGVLMFWIVMISLAGMIFTGYTMADFAIGVIHGFTKPDYIAHHVFFIAAGLVIRGNCVMPYNAAILMSMEASTPFLNQLILYRHHPSVYSTRLAISGPLFFLLFIFVRIALNTYGAVYLVLNRHYLLEVIPDWQGWFVIVSVLGGTAVQFFWLLPVLRGFATNVLGAGSQAKVPKEQDFPAEGPVPAI